MDRGRKIELFSVVGISLIIFVFFWLCLPRPLFQDPLSTVVEDRNGELLGARIAADGQWRFPYSEEIPEKFTQALVNYEDQYFYFHPGINPVSMLRAIRQNISAGEIVSGGSTISMQVIRLSRKNTARTVPEKLLEIILALRLEMGYSKKEILSLYASHAPFGGNVVGLEAASWRYYGRAPDNLSWSEAAVLAVLPNSPALIHPGRNREALQRKRDFVLEKLYAKNLIDSLTLYLSKLEPLPEKPHSLPSIAPHLVDQVYASHRGERIRTTILREYQDKLNQIILSHHIRLEANEIHNLASLIIDVENAEILAYTGNVRDPDHPEFSGEVDIISSRRSTGSILKPALYCMMLSFGEILPGTLFPDIPTHYSGYTPKNFTMTYDGAVPARKALSRSLNIPAVRMLQAFGLERFHYLLKKLGLTTLVYPADHYGLSLILGGAEGTLHEITGMYASFARILNHYNASGTYRNEDILMPDYILDNEQKNRPVDQAVSHFSDNNNLLNAAAIWLTFESLIEVNRPESEKGWKLFSSTRKIAWKTGTSFGFRDAWAIGTNPDFAVGVWAGNADGEGRPGLTGVAAAAPVLFDVFDFLPESSWFSPPFDEMRRIPVCRQSGHRAGVNCEDPDSVWVPESGLNTLPCPYHLLVHLDNKEQYRLNSSCADITEMKHVPWFVLPPVQEWYYKRIHPSYNSLPPLHPECSSDEDIEYMDLIYPKHTARIFIPYEMVGSRSKVVFEAAHRKPNTTIFWHLDEEYLGSTTHIHQFGLDPGNGHHLLTLVDEYGNSFSKSFEIINK